MWPTRWPRRPWPAPSAGDGRAGLRGRPADCFKPDPSPQRTGGRGGPASAISTIRRRPTRMLPPHRSAVTSGWCGSAAVNSRAPMWTAGRRLRRSTGRSGLARGGSGENLGRTCTTRAGSPGDRGGQDRRWCHGRDRGCCRVVALPVTWCYWHPRLPPRACSSATAPGRLRRRGARVGRRLTAGWA